MYPWIKGLIYGNDKSKEELSESRQIKRYNEFEALTNLTMDQNRMIMNLNDRIQAKDEEIKSLNLRIQELLERTVRATNVHGARNEPENNEYRSATDDSGSATDENGGATSKGGSTSEAIQESIFKLNKREKDIFLVLEASRDPVSAKELATVPTLKRQKINDHIIRTYISKMEKKGIPITRTRGAGNKMYYQISK